MSGATTIQVEGKSVILPAVEGGPGRGGFAFGVYKGGSTLLYAMLRRVTNPTQSKMPYVGFVNLFHGAGVLPEGAQFTEEAKASIRLWLNGTKAVYGGWREFPLNYDLPLDADTRTCLLVRDPRDCITSHYFSLKFSHTLDDASGDLVANARSQLQRVTIDEFALSQASTVLNRFAAYDALKKTNLLLLKYEDVIFNKEEMLQNLCSHFEIVTSRAHIQRVAADLDKRPAEEDVNAHIRQVTPGDYRRKLAASTIMSLNETLSPLLAKYEYN